MIQVKVGGQIEISGAGKALVNRIKTAMTIVNPNYAIAVKMNEKAKYTEPKNFTYYTQRGDKLWIPRGAYKRLVAFLDKCIDLDPLDYVLSYDLTSGALAMPVLHPTKGFELRDHQKDALAAIKADENLMVDYRTCMVEMAMGSGKSILGLELARLHQMKTLIIVDKKQLLYQWVAECKKFYGYTPGIIGDGKFEIKDVTIGMVQTMSKYDNYELAELFGVVIVDECHGFVTDKRIDVIAEFRPTYLYGLTATAQRAKADGRTKAINFIFGETVFEYNTDMLSPTVVPVETGITYCAKSFQRVEQECVDNDTRNSIIALKVAENVEKGRKVLVLTKRIEHYERIDAALEGSGFDVKVISSDDNTRHDLLARLKTGDEDFDVLIGTYSLLGTGFDVPRLDTLILAASVKSDVLLKQSCGRILRILQEKSKDPHIYDLIDNHLTYRRHWNERRKVYLERGWELKD